LSQRSQGFNPGSGGVGYTYDANGNLKSDSYKGISTIFYNHLNLPSLINFTSGNSIEYKYDAGGNKLRKTVKVGAVVQYEQYYVGGVEYRKTGTGNTRIEAIYHSEGRYANIDLDIDDSPNWRKEYNIKDHLGNTRLSFADKNGNGVIDITTTPATNDILQENHYYPFGLSYEGPWLMNDAARDNKYQYNGKEWNDDFGLNWYDYGARFYDAAIGRWGQVDALSDEPEQVDKFPYAYGWNNPTNLTDPDGNCPWCIAAIKGAVQEYVTQVVTNLSEGKNLKESLTNVNGKEILKAAVIDGATMGLGRLVKVVDTGLGLAKNAKKAEQLAKNAQKGAEFEKEVLENVSKTQTDVVKQITVKTNSGTKTRLDIVGKDAETGEIKLTEAKSSNTAPLTDKQKKAFPEIQKSGATVVGKGKGNFTGGTKIPPTKPDIVRPK